MSKGSAAAVERASRFHRGYLLRRLAWLGARHGPRWFLRYSPPLIGVALACVLGKERRAIQRNLRQVAATKAGSWAEHSKVFDTFACYAACFAESLALGRKEERSARYEYSGRERLSQLPNDSGLIVFTAHVGAWDVAARSLERSLQRKAIVVMSPEPSAAAKEWHNRLRRQASLEIFETSPDPLSSLRLLYHLKEGGLLAAQLDRTEKGQRSIEVRCGATTIRVPEGILRLASLAEVPILTVFCRRLGFFHYRCELGGPFRVAPRASRADLELAARSCAEQLEKFIAENPSQWFRFDG